MNQQITQLSGILLIALSTSNAAGDIVLVNDPGLPASADGFNLTRDTSTNLEWLDLDVSVGRTFDDMTGVDGSNEFLPGGDFEGFRYATHEELTGAFNGPQLDSLYKSLGISPFAFSYIGGYSEARALITIVGCFGSCASYGYSTGILLADDGVTEAVASMEAFPSQGFNWGRSDPSSNPILFAPNDKFPFAQGNWIVRDAPIADADGDSIADTVDNCIDVANTDQRDIDGDGHGSLCDADFDNDCNTSFLDLAMMQAGFFGSDPELDLDGNGTVTFPDLAIMSGLIFLPPGPSAPGSLCNP